MVLASAFLLLRVATNGSLAEALLQANQVAAKLNFRIEKTVAYLTIAQAENKLGHKTAALKALDLGWQAYTKGTDKGMSEGDRTDIQFLFNEGDSATLPEPFAVQYLEAGNKAKALEVADSFPDTPLGRAFRHGIGEKIQSRFPNDFYEFAYSPAERQRLLVKKLDWLAKVPKAKEEPNIGQRAYMLWDIANQITVYDGNKEAIEILQDAIVLAPKIEPVAIRVIFLSQAATTLNNAGAKAEAKSVMEEAIKLDVSLSNDANSGDSKEVQQARLMLEQNKRSLGMPNDLDKMLKDIEKANSSAPTTPDNGGQPTKVEPTDLSNPFQLLVKAEALVATKDIQGARVLLGKVGRITATEMDKTGSWLLNAAELQIRIGDKEAAKLNLTKASRMLVASFGTQWSRGEDMLTIETIARYQIQVGDKLGAVKTVNTAIQKMTAGPDTQKMMHMGDGGNHMVVHDRRSSTLHKGSILLARLGDFDSALAMARSIPSPAHRAIALAGIVRDFNVQP